MSVVDTIGQVAAQAAQAVGLEGIGKTVLITEVTATALEFVKHGFFVHATARSQSKIDEWKKAHPIASQRIKWFIVKDVAAENAHDTALQVCHIVAHTASPFTYDVKDVEKELLMPAIHGTQYVLESAAKVPSVKRVVVLSSFASVINMKTLPDVGKTYTEKDWNPATYDEAKDSSGAFAYCASKVLAEKAAWDFVKEKKPQFALSTICPPMIYGPPEQVIHSMDSLNTSSASIWEIVKGGDKLPDTGFPVAIDVRDVALAIVRAATLEQAKGERFMTVAFHYSNEQIAKYLKETFPEKASKIPASDGKPAFEHFATDSSKAEKTLGIRFIPFEPCIRDTAERLWHVEASLKK